MISTINSSKLVSKLKKLILVIYTKILLTDFVNELVSFILPICFNALERMTALGNTGYL